MTQLEGSEIGGNGEVGRLKSRLKSHGVDWGGLKEGETWKTRLNHFAGNGEGG